jgi:hypothetical protein
MVTAVTIGWPHQKGNAVQKPKVITGPEVPVDDHIKSFKKLCASRENAQFETVQILASNAGSIRSARFHPVSAKEVDKEQK